HGLWQYHGRGTRLGLRASSTPYFIFPHGMLDPWFKTAYPLKHVKKALYWRLIEARVLRDAAAVLFTCEEERRLAQTTFAAYRCTERIAPLGIEPPGGDPEVQSAAFKRQFPELAGQRVLLFLGRLHEKKGCDLLIRAFAEVCQAPIPEHQAPLHLMLAGPCADASYLESLNRLAASLHLPILNLPSSKHPPPITVSAPRLSVSFPGMLSGDVKWGALRAAEAFVLPSHQENFGIAVAEALACGTPVLISNKVNIWREIEGDGAGLVEDDTQKGTGRLVGAWIKLGQPEKERMREAAQSCFGQRFEVHRAAASLLDTLTELLEPAGGAHSAPTDPMRFSSAK
ncbi:MAG: glycosyl transferase group 1, partial [Chthoniobacter sp.]|nr:glycosyl transferase group 1 [Chthoniobacter sp.]